MDHPQCRAFEHAPEPVAPEVLLLYVLCFYTFKYFLIFTTAIQKTRFALFKSNTVTVVSSLLKEFYLKPKFN